MMFEIKIKQKGKYGDEVIKGATASYEDAISLINLVMTICKEVDVELTSTLTNKSPDEDEKED